MLGLLLFCVMQAIVNVSVGHHYPALGVELRKRCAVHCGDAKLVMYQKWPDFCPPHEVSQYEFKVHAMRAAISSGYNPVLWMDSTFRPRAPIAPLWDEIRRAGWYAPPQGDHVLGDWCTDKALSLYGIDRATARKIPLVLSGLFGLDFSTAVGVLIWNRWVKLCECGAFRGPHRAVPGPMRAWGNKTEGFVSDDPTVQGHRHDESALSFVLWKQGLKPKFTGFTTIESPDGFIERNF